MQKKLINEKYLTFKLERLPKLSDPQRKLEAFELLMNHNINVIVLIILVSIEKKRFIFHCTWLIVECP